MIMINIIVVIMIIAVVVIIIIIIAIIIVIIIIIIITTVVIIIIIIIYFHEDSPKTRLSMISCSPRVSPRRRLYRVPRNQGAPWPEISTSRTRGRMPPHDDSSLAHTPSFLESHRSMASRKRSVMMNMGCLSLDENKSPEEEEEEEEEEGGGAGPKGGEE